VGRRREGEIVRGEGEREGGEWVGTREGGRGRGRVMEKTREGVRGRWEGERKRECM